MAAVLSEYYGEGRYLGRYATFNWDGRKYSVRMYQDGKQVEERDLQGHNERYAEDCAENYVLGVF